MVVLPAKLCRGPTTSRADERGKMRVSMEYLRGEVVGVESRDFDHGPLPETVHLNLSGTLTGNYVTMLIYHRCMGGGADVNRREVVPRPKKC